MKKAIFLLLLALPVSAAHAITEGPKTIAYLGVQNNLAYVGFTEAFSVTCAWNNLYIDITTDKGKATYSTLLSARLANRPITRIDYVVTNNTCYIELVQI